MKKIVLAVFLLAPFSNLLYGQTNTFPSSGNVGIGTTSPGYKLNVVGAANEWKGMFQGPDGYILIGPANSGWAHIYSDRDAFLFNQSVYSMGSFSSFSGSDLHLQTYGTTRMTISNTSGNVGIGTTSPQYYRLELVDPNINESGIRSATTYGGNSSYSLVAYSPSYSNVPAYANKAVLQTYDNPIAFSAYGTTSNNQIHFYTGGRTDSFKRMVIDQNGFVGIGTSSPSGKLDINHAGGQLKLSGGTVAGGVWTNNTDILYLADWNTGTKGLNINMTSGNIGIGTAPITAAKLEVAGPSTGSGPTIRASGGGDVLMNSGGSLFFDGNYSYNSGNYIRPLAANTQAFFTSGSERLRITSSGNIGIGTTSPNEKLVVNGTIYGTRVKVDLTVQGPDYVFEQDYNLPSLVEIEKYINEHKHLPQVPSAKTMEQNGIDVGEMNMLLLKKVEEMTLHLIEVNKNLIEANIKIENLNNEVQILKSNSNK